MPCNPVVLKAVPLFSLLDEEELAVLASQVEFRRFAPRQRIYKMGNPSEHAFIMVSGSVQITTIDEDNQVVLLDMPIHGEVFGFASMLAQTPHQTDATAIEAPVIMMSQNRQDKKDRLRSELDFDVNRRAHVEIQGLAHRINLLHDKIDDVDEMLRKPGAS